MIQPSTSALRMAISLRLKPSCVTAFISFIVAIWGYVKTELKNEISISLKDGNALQISWKSKSELFFIDFIHNSIDVGQIEFKTRVSFGSASII